MLKTFICVLVSLIFCNADAAQGGFNGKEVDAVHSGDGRPCAFFSLVGVSEAVADVPGSPWIAVPQSHPHYKEIFAILLTAKLSSRKVNVITTGGAHSCGHAEASVAVIR